MTTSLDQLQSSMFSITKWLRKEPNTFTEKLLTRWYLDHHCWHWNILVVEQSSYENGSRGRVPSCHLSASYGTVSRPDGRKKHSVSAQNRKINSSS